jgi:hypothetical protein
MSVVYAAPTCCFYAVVVNYVQQMKIVNINTLEVIEEWPDIQGGPFWTTPEYWAEYKANCKLEEERVNRILYSAFEQSYKN